MGGDVLRVAVDSDELLHNCRGRRVVGRRPAVNADHSSAAGAGDLGDRTADPAGHPNTATVSSFCRSAAFDGAHPADDEIHPNGGGFVEPQATWAATVGAALAQWA